IRRWLPYALAGGLLNVGVSIAATVAFGMPGPLIGSFSSFVLVQAWAAPGLFDDIYGISRKHLWGSMLKPLVAGLPYILMLSYVARLPARDNWLRLLPEIGTAMAGGLALWWLFILN